MNKIRNCILAGGVVGGLVAAVSIFHFAAPRSAYAALGADDQAAPLTSPADLSAAFERVAERIRPSVVSVNSVKRIAVGQRQLNVPEQLLRSPFREFFGPDFPGLSQRGPGQRDLVQQGLGTGVVVSADGYILTNNHVVRNADTVTVGLPDKRTLTAKVVGTDPKTDLAVLKVNADHLQPVALGDSDALKIGEWVVAVGNPFGLSSTITAGIVSAKGRANVGLAEYEDFIQTDAAINPGNSGGPLVNLRGEVVGINTAILSKSGGYMGIGFAIPIDMARSIKDRLIDDGRVVRGWLGVYIQDLTSGLSKSFGFDGTDGVLVGDVTPGGPSAKAGLESGDIITEYDGQPVTDMQKLRERVAETRPGQKVKLRVFRDGKTRTVRLKIGELEAEVASSSGQTEPDELGIAVRSLTPDIARQLGYDSDMRGVVVTRVEPAGIADRAGLRARDVIVSVQGHDIGDISDFRAAMSKSQLHKGVRLGVRTGPARRFVYLKGPRDE